MPRRTAQTRSVQKIVRAICFLAIPLLLVATSLGARTSASKKRSAHRSPTPTPDEETTPTPKPTPRPKASPSPTASPEASPSATAKASPQSEANATLSTDELADFKSQPEQVRELIESALELTRLNLTYTYASADPENGGMDCSGFVYYVLKKKGFDGVPRQSNEQYMWLRKQNTFRAVLSNKDTSPELDELTPGDLLFWIGTYNIDRDPPVTHAMIYLGREKGSKKRVMVGSSDGRTYDGKSRWGVSVFDFKMNGRSKNERSFVGYAHLPALRVRAADDKTD
ncbi:MAG: NlpC/P60 family protein [Verrucomicrobiota bacterium]|nr:NlpC/P60 family protein [Verrucomicrobiota bacterium]